MLFGDAHVEAAARKALRELLEAGPVRHRGGHPQDAIVAARLIDQRLREDRGIAGRVRFRLGLHAGDHVELGGGMALVRGCLGRGITLALLGHDVDQDRTVGPRPHGAQQGQQLFHVVTVDRPDIGKAQLLEQGAAHGHALQHLLGAARALLQGVRQHADGALGHRLQLLERPACIKARQIGGHGADWGRNGHLVVIQDHEQALALMARIVQRLISHACAHGAVADDRDRIARVAAQFPRHRETQGRADRGRRMPRPERVIRAFRPLGEPRKAPAHAQRADAIAPPGQDLVRIALVPHVPDQLVARRVEDRVQGHGQLDHAQARAQMAAGHADGADGLGPQLVGKLAQLRVGQGLQIRRQANAVQNRRLGSIGHGWPSSGAGVQVSRSITKRARSCKFPAASP